MFTVKALSNKKYRLDHTLEVTKKPIRLFSTAQGSVNTASNRLNYFFRRGQKGAIEGKMRSMFIERAVKKPAATQEITNKFSTRFKSFFISATPFIGLKTRRRRRGKRVVNKVITLTRRRSQRKSFLEFASRICVSGRSKKPFRSRLEGELETLYSNSRKRNLASSVGSNPFYEKRAALYETAYLARGSARTGTTKSKGS
jgi:hypothetical protein